MKSTPTWTQRLGLHAHTHTHNHTHTHKHLCICIFTDKLALFPSQVNKHTTSHTCACQRTYPQIFLTCMPIASQMHTQACMDTFLCRHTHTHTHKHTLAFKIMKHPQLGSHWPRCMWVRPCKAVLIFLAVCLTVRRHVKKADC